MTQAIETIETIEVAPAESLAEAMDLLSVPGQGDPWYHLIRAGVGLAVFGASLLLLGALVTLLSAVKVPPALSLPFMVMLLVVSYIGAIYAVSHVAGGFCEAATATAFYLLSVTLAMSLLLTILWVCVTAYLTWEYYFQAVVSGSNI